MKKAKLFRLNDDGVQTIGQLMGFSEKGSPEFSISTIELPWKNNQRRISCIPPGTYLCQVTDSAKFGKGGFIHVKELDGSEVKGRSAIGIHVANYVNQLLGCVATGTYHKKINSDGSLDNFSSTTAFLELKKNMGNQFLLEIIAPPAK